MGAKFRVAEFFAGIGLVAKAVEDVDGSVIFANDIEPAKYRLYARNLPADPFKLGDIREIEGAEVPDAELATASFPCTDLSLAGNRAGLAGHQSGMFWEFARVLAEMGERAPYSVLLENVPSFATSHKGNDLAAAVQKLNSLGYVCDLLLVDAALFVPQSRPRLFIVGFREPWEGPGDTSPSPLRPEWLRRFCVERPDLRVHLRAYELPTPRAGSLAGVVERLPPADERWWDPERVERFKDGMVQLQRDRLESIVAGRKSTWRSAYRRTRQGRAVWEIRADEISGCLRTARGGSSKQALIEAGRGALRVRWMTPREYARLQGVDDGYRLEAVSANQALFGLGDAVCVPAVAWVLREAVLPQLQPLSARFPGSALVAA